MWMGSLVGVFNWKGLWPSVISQKGPACSHQRLQAHRWHLLVAANLSPERTEAQRVRCTRPPEPSSQRAGAARTDPLGSKVVERDLSI